MMQLGYLDRQNPKNAMSRTTLRTPTQSIFSIEGLAVALLSLVLTSATAVGQNTHTGVIIGRVFNPATGEYVRNAEVRLEGTDRTTNTEADGSFRIGNLPPGPNSLSVSYTGYLTVRETVTVGPGGTAVCEIKLTSGLLGAGALGATVKLQEFVVAAARQGNAKAIMEQKNSMNITNTIASDVFGDIAEGNVGEFLKNLPGVDLELTQGETRSIRLRGLDPVYNAVTIDGVSLASTDANSRGADARSFSFEQVSLSTIESVEVAKTISADVDANAPAGSINLKSKRAFSREGRRMAFQANLTGFVKELKLGKSYGPTGGDKYYKLRPGGSFEFSDVFARKLGVVLSVSESNLYSESARQTNTYNYTTTASDLRPIVPTQITITNVPRITSKSTVSLTADLKATGNLVLSLTAMYNSLSQLLQVRAANFVTGPRASVVGNDPLTRLTSATTGSVSLGTGVVGKLGVTYSVIPSFEYKRGSFLLEGKLAASDSKSWYNPLEHWDMVRNLATPVESNVLFTAVRSSPTNSDWAIRQTGGIDISTGQGFTAPRVQANDGRATRSQIRSGELAATFNTNVVLPIRWKSGLKCKEDIWDFRAVDQSRLYDYTGPGAGTGAWAPYNSPFAFASDRVDASITSLSGGNVFYPDHVLIGRLFKAHPEYFTPNMTADNYYTAMVDNFKHYEEALTAGFLMGTAKIRRAAVRLGLRWEGTTTTTLDPNPISAAEVLRAGFPVVNGRATTIPGIQYQFLSRPKVERSGSYKRLFPSASFKLDVRENLQLQLGYSTTMRRPSPSDVVGTVIVNEVTSTVSVPNPNLKPEKSENFSGRVAYYFEPVGLFAVNVFQNTVKGLHRGTNLTAAEYGYPGIGSDFSPIDLSNYRFNTTTSSDRQIVMRGMELEYRQSLSFLPWHLKYLTIQANYTRNYARAVMVGMSPRGINAGLSYAYSRLNVYANVNWRLGETPNNAVGNSYTRYDAARAPFDLGAGFRLTNNFSLFLNGRNVRSEPLVTKERVGANQSVSQITEVTGAVWTLGIKGVF